MTTELLVPIITIDANTNKTKSEIFRDPKTDRLL